MRIDSFRSLKLGAALALGLSLALTGCQGSSEQADPTPSQSAEETPTATPTPEATTITDLSSISVSDDMSAAPQVDATWPLKVDQTMSTTIVAGTGRQIPSEEATVSVQYVGINASTGETFDSSWDYGTPVTFALSNLVTGFKQELNGVAVGSRVLMALAPEDGYGASGGNAQAGIGAEDTILFVVDVIDVALDAPEGQSQDLPAGLPHVDQSGEVPTITIGSAAEPTETTVNDLITGTGRALGADDSLGSHAVCVTWDGTEYYNDYGEELAFDSAQGQVHKALWEALQGHTIGSRVLVTMPGSIAYPNGSTSPAIEANTSVACVVDLLFASQS